MATSYVFFLKINSQKSNKGRGVQAHSAPPPLVDPPACRVVSSKVVSIFKKMIRPPAS